MALINPLTGEIPDELDTIILEQIQTANAMRAGFEARIWERWNEPLVFLQGLLLLAREAGTAWIRARSAGPERMMRIDDAFISRLHMRGCRTASEVIALLLTGHADGALARWRTLHELVVVARVLRKHGPVPARRLADSYAIDQYRAMREYQRFAPHLGFARIAPDDARAISHRYKEVEKSYRPNDFKALADRNFGWAFGFVRSGSPTFEDLEQEVGLAKYRPVYRWSNHSIHATTGGLLSSLGDPFRESMTLSSPSNAGLADPGQFTAIHLTMLTEALLCPPDSVPSARPGWEPDGNEFNDWEERWLNLMYAFTEEAADAFARVDEELAEEERALRS